MPVRKRRRPQAGLQPRPTAHFPCVFLGGYQPLIFPQSQFTNTAGGRIKSYTIHILSANRQTQQNIVCRHFSGDKFLSDEIGISTAAVNGGPFNKIPRHKVVSINVLGRNIQRKCDFFVFRVTLDQADRKTGAANKSVGTFLDPIIGIGGAVCGLQNFTADRRG